MVVSSEMFQGQTGLATQFMHFSLYLGIIPEIPCDYAHYQRDFCANSQDLGRSFYTMCTSL